MATDPWAGFEEVTTAPPAAPSFPGVIPGRPKAPAQPTPPSDFTVQTDVRDFDRQTEQDRLKRIDTYRTEFLGNQTVKQFQDVYNATKQISDLARGEGSAMGDLGLVFSYMKALDPGSTVREGEQATAQNAAGIPDQIRNAYNKLASGERLSPRQRQDMATTALTIYQTRAQTYNDFAKTYRGLIEEVGDDPDKHGIRLAPELKAAATGNGTVPTATTPIPGVIDPSREEIYSQGLKWGDQWTDMEASVSDYLEKNYGVGPGDEAKINAFWNANRGNKDLTVDGVLEWYRRQGFSTDLNPADIAASIKAAQTPGVEFTGSGLEGAESSYREQLDKVLEERNANPESAQGAIGINAAQGIFPLLDETAGVGGAINAAIHGQNPIAGYKAERDVLRREQERAEQARPYLSLGAALGGALLTGGAGFSAPARISRVASIARKAGNVGRAAQLQGQSIRAAGKAGALTGAAYGFASGEGLGGSLAGAAIGAPLGGLGAAGVQAIAPHAAGVLSRVPGLQRLTQAPQGPTREQAGVIAAGQRRNVPIRPADVRPELRHQLGVARTSEGGNPIIRAADAEDAVAMEQSVISDVGGAGNAAPDAVALGERAQTVLTRQRDRTGRNARRFYELADRASNGQKFTPQNAVKTLASEIVRLEGEGADPAIIGFLQRQGELLSRPEGWTAMQFHAYRSSLRKNIRAAGLPVDAAELPILRAVDAAKADITTALANNPRALRAVERGDEIWTERTEFRKQVTDRLFGRARDYSPDQTARALESMARSDTQRFSAYLDELTPEEKTDLAATVATQLGRDNKGEFSIARFISQTEGKQALVTPRSLRLLFGDDGVEALQDLRAIAGAKQAAVSETNYSRTGNVVQSAKKGVRNLVLAWMGFTAGDVTGAVVAPAAGNFFSKLGEKRAARLLTNPDFTGWLRRMPNTSDPRAIDRYFARLDSLAARSPSLAGDVDAFRQALMGAANDNAATVSTAAAEQPEQR